MVMYTPRPPAKPRPKLPQTAFERATAFLDVSGRLSGLLSREFSALRARDKASLTAIGVDKRKLAVAYEELGRLLRIDPEGMKSLDPATKRALRDSVEDLRQTAEQGFGVLRARSAAQQGLVDFVVKTINGDRATAGQYGQQSGRAVRVVPTSGPVASATFNTTV